MASRAICLKLTKANQKNCFSIIKRFNANLINGKAIAEEIQAELKVDIEKWIKETQKRPMLVALLVGDDPASATYVSHKMKVAKKVGVESRTEQYPASFEEKLILKRIAELNQDNNVDGILVQLPLPKHINDQLVCRSINPEKDVDGFSAINIGQVALAREALVPCTPLGVIELLKRSNVVTKGKHAVIIGRSKNVGLPIALLLQNRGFDATTTICHSGTPPEQMKAMCLSADILVVATGFPRVVKADMVKSGAIVIDVGITRETDATSGKTRLVGDVDFEGVRKVAGAITPVPGGVGPMTVTMLMHNAFLAAKWRNQRNTSPINSVLSFAQKP